MTAQPLLTARGPVSAGIHAAWDRIVASDPGLARLRMAISGAVSLLTTIGIEYLFTHALGVTGKKAMIFYMLGGVSGMFGTMALFGVGRKIVTRLRTVAGFPVAIGAGLVSGVLFGQPKALTLTMFVVVTFFAVWVRRFGPSFFSYGLMGWMGYLLASRSQATFGELPLMFLALIVAAAWLGLLSITVLRVNPSTVLISSLAAFQARIRRIVALCGAFADLDPGDPNELARWRRRLDRQQRQLAEAALMLEASSGQSRTLPNAAAGRRLRAQALQAQLAADGLSGGVGGVTRHAPGYTAAAGEVARLVGAGAFPAARQAAEALQAQVVADHAGSGAAWAAYRLVDAVGDFARTAETATDFSPAGIRALVEEVSTVSADSGDAPAPFDPAVGLSKGDLPGSVEVAKSVPARGPRWLGRRLSLTTRQAVQATVASALAVLAGVAVSHYRYYWALIAVFMTFSGTTTRAESARKALYRVLGTLAGLVVAIALANATRGKGPMVLVIIGVSVFCGMYLKRISYVFMIFFTTVMLGQLYSALGEFSDQLLVLRLIETMVGAAIGIVVSLVFLPLSTDDTVLAARRRVLDTLRDALETVATRLDGGGGSSPVDPHTGAGVAPARVGPDDLDLRARRLDEAVRQLEDVSTPFARPVMWGNSGRSVRFRLARYRAITVEVRAIAVAFGRPGVPTDPMLADLARALAEAAGGLDSGDDPEGFSVAGDVAENDSEPSFGVVDVGRLLGDRLPGDGLPPHGEITGALLRIDRLLGQIASQLPAEINRRASRAHATRRPVSASTG